MINRISFLIVTSLSFFSFLSQSQTPCVDGMAGIYPCENVDLMSTISLADLGGVTNMNDIWGWTDAESEREFAIVGLRNGTSFVEVTDPVNPAVLGFLETATVNSLWRDVKVYNDYAFIVSEASAHGMQVFDLSQLLMAEEGLNTFLPDTTYNNFGNAHNIVINEETGYAYAVGTGTFSGGLHMVDISDPLNPEIVGGFGGDGYTHDAQVIIYDGPDSDYLGREIAFCANEDAITIVDVTDKEDPVQLSTIGYEFSAYTHQGWLTDDRSYFIFNDEIDETSGFTPTTKTLFLNVEDLDEPFLHESFFSTSTAIDHNLYNKGSLSYQSNYRSGLRILDVGNVPEFDVSVVGYFDSQPTDDNQEYSGTWSNYVYFPSGTVIMSDMYSDLFILQPRIINAYRYQKVCGSVEQVEFYIDVTDNQVISEVFSTDFLPNDMSVEIGEVIAPGQIPVTVTFSDVIEDGEYLIPVSVYNGEEELFTDNVKIVVDNGAEPVFTGLTPADDFITDEPVVTLSWDELDGFNEYTIIISDDESFNSILVEETITGNSYEFNGVGDFFWKVQVTNLCRIDYESEVLSFTNNYVGINDLYSSFTLYPNPANDYLRFTGLNTEESFSISSISGKVIQTGLMSGADKKVNIADLTAGVYVFTIENSPVHFKFIKE